MSQTMMMGVGRAHDSGLPSHEKTDIGVARFSGYWKGSMAVLELFYKGYYTCRVRGCAEDV